MKFAGKVAVVTGAARGIGAAIALAFGREGADVLVNDIGDGEPVAAEIRALGRRALFVRCDVADQNAVEAMIERAAGELGHVDIACPNAAFSERGKFHDTPMEGFYRTVNVTMWGPFYCMRAAARQMIKQGTGGAIVATGSPHAIVPVADCMAYNMAKAAVDMMVRTAATELFPHRIRVNVVHPGWVDTPGERKFYSEEDIKKHGDRLPWKRLCRPDEIARGVLFLAHDDSEYITGTTLTIDGGIQLPWSQFI